MIINKKYKEHKETIHNFFWRSLQILGKQGITFLIFIFCAKLLTPQEFGIYNYVLAIIFFLIMFGDFGISTATSKYVAEYNVTNKEKIKSILFNSGLIIVGLTLIISILTIIFGKVYLQDKYVYVIYLIPLIFLAPMTSLYDGIYRGLNRFKSLAIISTIIGFISLSFVYIFIKHYGLAGALWAQCLFYLLLFIALALNYREFNFKLNREVMKEIGNYSFIIGLGSIGLLLYSRIDVLFLGNYGYIIEISYYEIINKILMLILIPFTIISQVISPKITSLYAHKNMNAIKIKFKKYFFFSLLCSIIIVILLWLSYPLLISLLPEYNNPTLKKIYFLMLPVFFTQVLNGIVPIGFSTSTGHARLNTYFLLVFGGIHVILNYLLINTYGFIGIIYSIIFTKIITDVLFMIVYYKTLNLK